MLRLIDSVRLDKEAYLALERAGDNLIDVLPAGIMRRAPQPIERFAAARVNDSKTWGIHACTFIHKTIITRTVQ
jgi:hypothetical protein